MKFVFSAALIAVTSVCAGQTAAPWNPDSNGDQLVTTSDLLEVLNVFGNTVAVEVNCTEYESLLDSLSNLVDILSAYPLFGCTDSSACNFDPYANSSDESCEYLDLCGICGGDGASCGSCDADVCLWIEDNSIFYSTDLNIAGFQFDLDCVANPVVCCGPVGWTVVSGTSVILGFDMNASSITGSGILFSFTDDACFDFEEIIFSDSQGYPINDIELGWE